MIKKSIALFAAAFLSFQSYAAVVTTTIESIGITYRDTNYLYVNVELADSLTCGTNSSYDLRIVLGSEHTSYAGQPSEAFINYTAFLNAGEKGQSVELDEAHINWYGAMGMCQLWYTGTAADKDRGVKFVFTNP